jgi:hypothetical protein
VNGEAIFEADVHFAELGRILEQVAFDFRRGHLGAGSL